MMALVAFGMLAYLLIAFWATGRRARGAMVAGAVVLVAAIGFSRLYDSVHYFSDVVGGYAAGTVWVAASASGADVARRRRPVAPPAPSSVAASSPGA